MMSHIGMKFHFLKGEVDKLAAQNDLLKKRVGNIKGELRNVKSEEAKLSTERGNLEDKEVLLTNMKMLRDFKETSELLELEMENNKIRRKKLGHWWEGFQE